MVIHQNSKTDNQEKAVTLGTFGALLATTLVSGGVMAGIPASADSDTHTSSVSVTVSSACTISSDNASGISKSIDPGIRDDELGTTTMTAMCNNPQGYDVYAVGYSNNEWKNNQMIGILDDNKFNTRERGDGSYTDASHWYMKLDKPTGSNISIENNYNNYSRIPGTSDKTDGTDEGYVKVASLASTTQGISSADFQVTYGAYVTSAQSADTYTGQVKYTIVSPQGTDAPEVPKPYMQDYTLAQCKAGASDDNAVVVDRRDGSDYTVRYINDVCWMTQNLRIAGAITAEYSNFSGSDFNTSTGGDLKGGSNSYTVAMSHVADDNDVAASNSQYTKDQLGAWYNYCAASAGTVCEQVQKDAASDICPAGWHLPTGGYDANTSLQQSLVDAIGSSPLLFYPIYGGSYIGGSPDNANSRAYWWSSTAGTANAQHDMLYSTSGLGTGSNYKSNGSFIRCVRTE